MYIESFHECGEIHKRTSLQNPTVEFEEDKKKAQTTTKTLSYRRLLKALSVNVFVTVQEETQTDRQAETHVLENGRFFQKEEEYVVCRLLPPGNTEVWSCIG